MKAMGVKGSEKGVKGSEKGVKGSERTIAPSSSFVLSLPFTPSHSLSLPLTPLHSLSLLFFLIFNFQFSISHSQVVLFSHHGGFHADTFALAMHLDLAPEGEPLTIHYTLNGNTPTECDPVYSTPLPLTSALYSPSAAYRIQNVPDDRWFQPDSVERIIVVRAAAFDSTGTRRSPVNTQSFFIDSLLRRTIPLPVISLCADSLALFDYDTGILVRGQCFDPRHPYRTGNYFQRGILWERPASFEYYDSNGASLAIDCGLRVHGNSQRVLSQKGLSIYARNLYGASHFDLPFFADSPLERYQRLVLRPWKTSWSAAGVEDWLCQRIAEPLRFDRLASRPVVLFLNGEYWGIYFLEEKADEHYVQDHYRVDNRAVSFLAYWGDEVENGTSTRWNALYDWLLGADLTSTPNYNYLASQVDTGALMDYMLMQILVANDDWPISNVRFWAAPGMPWRWVFFDGDGTLATLPESPAILDRMTYANAGFTTRTSPKATLLFRRLLSNRNFLERSARRMEELVDKYFNYQRTAPLLNDMATQVVAEVPYQIKRFDAPSSMMAWRTAIAAIDSYLRTEPQLMLEEFRRYFGLQPPEPQLAVDEGGVLRFDAGTTQVILYDINGRILAQLPVSGDATSLQLPAMPPGRYFIFTDNNATAILWTIRNS